MNTNRPNLPRGTASRLAYVANVQASLGLDHHVLSLAEADLALEFYQSATSCAAAAAAIKARRAIEAVVPGFYQEA
jgi:hypothetical protein